jgi:hypothetical protein
MSLSSNRPPTSARSALAGMTVLVLAAAMALLALVPPGTASAAGDYRVWSCRDAAGASLATDAWIPFGNVANPLAHSDTCAAAGGWLGAQMIDPADYAGGALTGYWLTAPPGTSITGYRVEMAGRTSSPPGGTHFELGLLLGGDPLVATGNGCNTDLDPCTFGDLAAAWNDPANVFTASALSLDGLSFAATCTAPSACIAGANASPYPAFGRLYRSQVVLADPQAPIVGALGGSAAADGVLSGRRTVIADVSDVGGGVWRAQLVVDGTVVDQIDGQGRCAQPFTSVAPCPNALQERFELDTTALADGPHQLVVRAWDAAMNLTDSAPRAVIVDNAPAPATVITVPVPAPGPATSTATPSAASSEQGSPSSPATTPSAPVDVLLRVDAPKGRQTLPRRRALHGIVVRTDGTPAAGVPVRFDRRAFGADDDGWTPAGTTTTGPGGAYALPVTRRSGQLRVAIDDDRFAGKPVTLGFVAPIRLKATASAASVRNGNAFTLRARVSGDGGAFAGREALVQARVRGHWRTVDTVEVGTRGLAAWRYRFTSTVLTTRYRLRVVLPKTKGLPWRRTVTQPVGVLVRGSRMERETRN